MYNMNRNTTTKESKKEIKKDNFFAEILEDSYDKTSEIKKRKSKLQEQVFLESCVLDNNFINEHESDSNSISNNHNLRENMNVMTYNNSSKSTLNNIQKQNGKMKNYNNYN